MGLIDGIKNIKDISTLLSYLYMGEDKTITYNNARIRMDDDFNIWYTNLKFPDLPEMEFNDQMTVPYMINILGALRQTSPVEFPESFRNRWDEISTQVETMMALNKDKFSSYQELGKVINNCELIGMHGYPEQIDGKCLGFQKSDVDDEPCEQCKTCKLNLYYEE